MLPCVSYLICGTSRSGSTLLSEALTNTNLAGRPAEYFNTLHMARWAERWGTSNHTDYLHKALEEGMTPNGVFGAKLEWPELQEGGFFGKGSFPEYSGKATHELLAALFPNLHYIWITRRDKVRQAISHWKATQTNIWAMPKEQKVALNDPRLNYTFVWDRDHKRPAAPTALRFNFSLIDDLVHEIVYQEAAWAQYFAEARIKPFTVVYEDLALDYEGTALQILQYLNIPIPKDVVFAERRLQKQADAQSEEWVRRYYQHKRLQHRLRVIASLPFILRQKELRRNYLKPTLERIAGGSTLGTRLLDLL